MHPFKDIAAERRRASQAFRATPDLTEWRSAYLYVDLARLHLESGCFTAAASWLRRARVLDGGASGAFAVRCVEAALSYELLYGNAAGLCVVRNELTEAEPSTIWADSHDLDIAQAGLFGDELDWCLPHYALVCRYRRQDRQSQARAGWAVGTEAAGQRLGSAHLLSSRNELETLRNLPLLCMAAALEAAGLAWTVRRPDEAEAILTMANAIATDDIRAVLAVYAALARFDARHAPLSSAATWNMNVRVSERDCSELGTSIERAECRSPNDEGIDQELAELDRMSQNVSSTHARPVDIQLALRRAFAFALAGAFKDAASRCEHAAVLCAASADHRELPRALCMALIARISAGDQDDLRTAEEHFGKLIRALHRTGSRSWALGCCLLLSRWGRHSLIQRGNYPAATASFSFAYRLSTEFRLATHAAQSLVDLASADESIGFRHLSCARFRLAAAAFIGACEQVTAVDQSVFNRAVFVLSRSALAYAHERDAQATSFICQDLEHVIHLVMRRALLAPPGDRRVENELWVRHATDRLKFLRVIDCLARVLNARREGDSAAVAVALTDSRLFMSGMAAGDRAFWELQFARESNDLATADLAASNWATAGLAGGPLHEIECLLAQAEGDLARDELHVHRVNTGLTHLKVLLSVQRYPEAAEQLRRLEVEAGTDWFDLFAEHRLLGRVDKVKVLLGCGQPETAYELCLEVLGLYEALEAQVSDDSRLMSVSVEPGLSDAYVLAAAAAQALGDDRKAFALAEAGRARALKYLIAHRENAWASHLADVDAERRLGIDLASSATERYAATRQTASRLHGAFHIFAEDAVLDGRPTVESALHNATRHSAAELQHKFRTLANVEAVAAHCPADTALLAFSFVEGICLSWAMDASGTLLAHRLPIETRLLNDLIARYVRACRKCEPLEDLALQLGRLLLAPHRGLLESKRHIVIVPHGDTFRLPFHALPMDESGPCLGAHRGVRYLPAATLQAPTSAVSNPEIGGPLVLGCPDYLGDNIHRELQRVAEALECDVHLSKDLGRLETLRRLCGASRIHIAAHAETDRVQPWNSALKLFGEDAPLTAADIGRLPLRARLVTLGACSTGVPDRTRSDLTGFSRALLAAGVGTCVVSLWNVHGPATEVLMSHFHRSVASGTAPSVALAEAQAIVRQGNAAGPFGNTATRTVRMMRPGTANSVAGEAPSWSHPYYWAGFVAIGIDEVRPL